jgi:hypothetical protein
VRRAGLAALAAAALLLAAPTAALAHFVSPEQVEAGLRDPATRRAFGISRVSRDARLPRLLVVEVGSAWERVDPEERRRAAEAWRELWREAAPSGVIAIVDPAGRSLVGFDANGRARLRQGGGAAE